jgi:hypothetical protein
MATATMKERLATMGAVPGVQDSAGFTRVIQDETRRWAPKPGATVAATTTTAQKP